MNKKIKILFFCTIFVGGRLTAQQSLVADSTSILFHSFSKPLPDSTLLVFKPAASPQKIRVIQPNFYAANLGYFCKQEIKFEKMTKIPFRFRLGSVAACDYLEGKQRVR